MAHRPIWGIRRQGILVHHRLKKMKIAIVATSASIFAFLLSVATMKMAVLERWWIYSQLPFICLCIYWGSFPPMPTLAISVAALAAVVMTVRLEHHPTIYEKVAWIVIVAVLVVIDVEAIKIERGKNEELQANIRLEERASRFLLVSQNKIAMESNLSHFTDLSDRDRNIFENTQKAIEISTGGSGYYYLVPRAYGGNSGAPWTLVVGNSSPVAMPYCTFHVVDEGFVPKNAEEIKRKSDGILNFLLQYVPPVQHAPHTLDYKLSVVDDAKYSILINTPTRQFLETISFRKTQYGTYDPFCEVSSLPENKIVMKTCKAIGDK